MPEVNEIGPEKRDYLLIPRIGFGAKAGLLFRQELFQNFTN
jgi:hypothetical protein